MKILLVNTYYSPEIFGGAEYSVKKLAEELQIKGNEVKVLCTGYKDTNEFIDGIEIIRIRSKNLCRGCDAAKYPVWKRIIRRCLDIWNPFNEFKIKKILEQFEPDIIHTNGLYDISTIVWKIASEMDIKVVHTIRDYHLLCPFTSLKCSKIKKDCPSVPPKIFCRLHRSFNRKHSKYVDIVTAPSKVTLEMLLKQGFFCNAQKRVIENATDFDIEEVSKILNYRFKKIDSKIKFVFIGTFSEQKGLRWLIDSFENIDGAAELYIAGKGKLQNFIEQKSKDNKNIKYEGFLDEKGVDELLTKCDVLICPSQWQEPFGRVVLDAYKHAMPVICSDQGALPQLVENQKTGFVVKSGDTKKLADAMYIYISRHDIYCLHAQEAVRKLKNYSLENQERAFEKSYRE